MGLLIGYTGAGCGLAIRYAEGRLRTRVANAWLGAGSLGSRNLNEVSRLYSRTKKGSIPYVWCNGEKLAVDIVHIVVLKQDFIAARESAI